MAQNFEVHADVRSDLGKGNNRRMRRLTDSIPAILYGAGQDPLPLTLNHNQIKKSLENEAFFSHILTVHVDGKQEKAILRAIQRHPYKPKIMHMDFQRISAKEKLHMQVPLHFIGETEAPGVKLRGGIISHLETNVEVTCLPADLPEFIDVDVSKLEVDEGLHLSDLKLPKGVELVELSHGHNNDLPIVSIHLPRAAKEDEETPTPVTEVINEKTPEKAADAGENKK